MAMLGELRAARRMFEVQCVTFSWPPDQKIFIIRCSLTFVWPDESGQVAHRRHVYSEEEIFFVEQRVNCHWVYGQERRSEMTKTGLAMKSALLSEHLGIRPRSQNARMQQAGNSPVDRFKRMEDGDESALANRRVWWEMSVKKYIEECERLNVSFKVYTGESEVEMGLISDADGAKLVDLEKWKLGKAVLREANGTSIHLTRDLGDAIERWEKYHFDKMIYVVASQQDLHLSQFFKMLSLMEFPWADRLEHVDYGLVLGMSTRKGTAVLGYFVKDAGDC
ncbi:hypothetical protein CY34DRAFT_106298 [Suillus luteus UH-Slu-Lm8-n1]|uniref:Arginyl-tRNA synthetase catalytic core domain-containing protein n=1 Tax=Suillus luteus UH-Slu-Lm8-n1 TaxID=930992 RepID=A0A0D0BBS5_9AGAM|nr:hypothetical protein CY34DRAFT_106298 [Suillus luteus UH-Slu-Lm8-n1]